jgi:hypothetical protein
MEPIRKFHGYQYQRGGGIGNILGGLVKTIMQPWVISGAKKILPHVARFGGGVLSDIAQGEKLTDALKQRGLEAGGNVLNELVSSRGRGSRRPRSQKFQRGRGLSRPILVQKRKHHIRKKRTPKRQLKRKRQRKQSHKKKSSKQTPSRKKRRGKRKQNFKDIFN